MHHSSENIASMRLNFDAKIVIVQPNLETFQPDLADLEAKITARTKALIVNTPNNPTGVIYKPQTMEQIGAILEKKQAEFGTDIYLISDEAVPGAGV